MSGCVVTTSEWGPMLVPVNDEYVGKALIATGLYSPIEWQGWVPYLAYGHHVVEVGTHCGAFTLPFARAVGHRGKVTGYEAQRGLAMMANGTLALNGMWHAEVLNRAVGAHTGVLQMERRDYMRQGNYGAIEGIDEGHGDPVPLTTLDHEAIARCDFLKIDVEGAEYQVLAGAKQTIRRCAPVICCEADRQDGNVKVFPWLRQMGYTLYWQTPKLGGEHAEFSAVNVLCLPQGRPELPEPAGMRKVGHGEVWPV